MRLAALLLMVAATRADAAGVAIYAGYWAEPESKQGTVQFFWPNYYLQSLGKGSPGKVKFADETPLVKSSEVLEVKAIDITRPQGTGLVKLKLSRSGKESLERFFNKWTENPEPKTRNLLFVVDREVKLVFEVSWLWLSIDEIYIQASSRAEAEQLESALRGER